jgi:hypothetical protein
MIKLRTELKRILKEIHPDVIVDGESISRVHFEKATDVTPFPYVVFDLPQSYDIDDQEIFNLDIDIYDDDEDTTTLETLSNSIWQRLNKYYFINEDMQFSIHRLRRFIIKSDEDNIRRRTLMFNIRYYDRKAS